MGESESAKKIEEEVRRVVEQAKELQDSAASFISKASADDQSLRNRAVSLDSSIRRLHSLLSHNDHNLLDPKLADKLEEDLQRARCIMVDGDAASFLPPKTQGGFLKMFLGPINVRASQKDVQLKVKEEYNSYRDRTALLFLFFPAALLILRSWIWDGCLPAFPVQLYQAWLLFLYTGLALRENILRVNGSDIRPWWIYHHYCAMGMALVSLTWEIRGQPNCAQKQRGVQLFLQWAMMQGVAMLLQNRYQRQRLYTRIALGKAKRMDVVWGETAGVTGQLWLLCPILFAMQNLWDFMGPSGTVSDLLFGWWNWLGKVSSHIWNLVPLCLMWCIWKEHNRRTFEDLDRSDDQMLALFSGSLHDWARAWGLNQ